MSSVATNERDPGHTEPKRVARPIDPFPNMVRDYCAAVQSFYRNLRRLATPDTPTEGPDDR